MKSKQINIKPALITWARERARRTTQDLAHKFAKLALWEAGEAQPTLKQLEAFAHTVHVPIGYLLLSEPPEENLPIADFRTLGDRAVPRPSPNLLDTIYLCQQRQAWYQDHARRQDEPALNFVGSAQVEHDPIATANAMREALAFTTADQRNASNWETALRILRGKIEAIGVLVMVSGVVGGNTHRKLEVEEFRGFALADSWAPVIFINGADSKAAQMFTLAHELAHIWLGETGLSNTATGLVSDKKTEHWCNAVAAELLMPMDTVREAYQADRPLMDEIQRLAKAFKVSTLVALRRLYDAEFISKNKLWATYQEEAERLRTLAANNKGTGGGDFYNTLPTRTSKRFAKAVMTSTLEGHTLFRDAYHLLGVKTNAAFYKAARKLKMSL